MSYDQQTRVSAAGDFSYALQEPQTHHRGRRNDRRRRHPGDVMRLNQKLRHVRAEASRSLGPMPGQLEAWAWPDVIC
jgi:hypothetical protein